MTMMELFEAGYTITCGTVYGDTVMETAEDVESWEEEGMEPSELDETAMTAYFYFEEDWDAYGEDL